MNNLKDFEASVEDLYKNLPTLPKKFQLLIVKFLPYLISFISIIYLFAVWLLWHSGHSINHIDTNLNSIDIYGGKIIADQKLGISYWLTFTVLLVIITLCLSSIVYLLKRKRMGWTILFYVTIINVFCGLFIMFTVFGNNYSFIECLIISFVSLYFLYQIKDYYIDFDYVIFKIKK
jgi:hypothetical protein